jgi:type IV pilus assembly protein PilB
MEYTWLDSLVQQNLLSHGAAQAALHATKQKNLSLAIYLAQNQLIDGKVLAQTIAQHFKLPQIDLSQFHLQNIQTDLLDEKLIKKHWVLPLQKNQQQLQLAILDPTQTQALAEIKFQSGLNLQLVIAEYAQLSRSIQALLSKKQYVAIQTTPELINDTQTDASVVHFVQQIFDDAISQGASDIHFEPYENYYRIRMRIDGILYEITQPPLNLGNRFASRIKVLAKLDIAEKRLPQDGRFSINHAKMMRECRISTCPTLYGEKIVIRILDPATSSLNIDELGFEPKQKQIFLDTIKAPQGMILVTGPTGSGKTVTLYTALNLLNTLDKNISTVEDPVEINLAGINQVHVNPKIGLSFSNTLRAFLRQDPDIIMVGEIRDLETAEIAMRAAQTGHLVLSTLHTNSAPETLTRLSNMGIAPFNIASSVKLIVAQRLARRLCPQCKQLQKIPASALVQEGFRTDEISTLEIFSAGECKNCIKGYKGRVAIYEVMPINESLTQLIMNNGTSLALAEQATKLGMQSLRASGLNKVRGGVTSLEEINRVITRT